MGKEHIVHVERARAEGGEYGIFGWTEAFGARKVCSRKAGGLVSYRNGGAVVCHLPPCSSFIGVLAG